MARKDLGKLVALANQGDEAQPAPEPAVTPEPERPSVEAKTAPAAAPSKKTERADELAPKRATRTAKAKPAAPAAAEPEDDQPLYLTLERKDTRLREDQIILLTQTARRHKVRPPALVVIGSVLSLIPKSEGCPAVSWEQLTAFADLHKAPDCP